MAASIERWTDCLSNATDNGGITVPLVSSPSSLSLNTGTGLDVFSKTILPLIARAERKVIIVTCFWAQSDTLAALSATLKDLSTRVVARHDQSRIRVRLCFSSRTFFQKIFHTSSRDGYVYQEHEHAKKLGLPPPSELPGLDIEVKSLFFRPISVLHPKFVIIDREIALFPSCNVSWENWYECCLCVRGDVVEHLLRFYQDTWEPSRQDQAQSTTIFNAKETNRQEDQVVLLPSTWHNSWSTSFPVSMTERSFPPTQLNIFVMNAIDSASRNIDFITPNVTSSHVLEAILRAVRRGVDVSIITNPRMMILEQLLTARTITELCMWRLKRAYRRLQRQASLTQSVESHYRLGKLSIEYFAPFKQTQKEIVKSHVKCTLVDGEVIVLGSGNMDRASWMSSQELGIAILDKRRANSLWQEIKNGLQDLTTYYVSSDAS